MDEIITIEFPANMEGITWKKRKPRVINTINKTIANQTKTENASFENKKDDSLKNGKESIESKKSANSKNKIDLFDDFLNIQKYVNKRIEESSSLKKTLEKQDFIKKMNLLLKEIDSHKAKYTDTKLVKDYVRKINDVIKKLQDSEQEQKTRLTININIYKSQKCLEIEKILTDLKKVVKRSDLTDTDKESYLKQLEKMKKDIESNLSVFTKYDNIPMRLKQIEQYQNILNGYSYKTEKTIVKTEESSADTTEKPKKKTRVVLRSHSLS